MSDLSIHAELELNALTIRVLEPQALVTQPSDLLDAAEFQTAEVLFIWGPGREQRHRVTVFLHRDAIVGVETPGEGAKFFNAYDDGLPEERTVTPENANDAPQFSYHSPLRPLDLGWARHAHYEGDPERARTPNFIRQEPQYDISPWTPDTIYTFDAPLSDHFVNQWSLIRLQEDPHV